jgi:hypothetical protein
MDLLAQPTPTMLPEDTAAAAVAAGQAPESIAANFPGSSLAWATLAEQAREEGATIQGYAFARVGYHRGLDALRRNGWKGHGPVPWSHVPNRGFLMCLYELSLASTAISETDEAERTATFLRDSSAEAADALGL